MNTKMDGAPRRIPHFHQTRQLTEVALMDPLTALSVAGTIVQFADFGCKLLSGYRELYKSTSGTLAANEEIELVTVDLQAVVLKLRRSVCPKDPSNSLIKDDQ